MLTIQLAVNALALGSAYALAALGFVLTLNATRAVNFAHGDMAVAGGYAAIALTAIVPMPDRFPAALILPLLVPLMALSGWALCLVAYRPLADKPIVSVFVSTIAIGIVLQNALLGLFGPTPQAPPALADGVTHWAGVTAPTQSLATILIAAVLLAATGFLLHRTQLGRHMRAAAIDPDTARALGVPVARLTGFSFALATALAGAAGLLFGARYLLTPVDGSLLMLKAYMAATIGGWGSIRGALAGAMLIAIFEVGVGAALSQPVAEALLFGCLMGILALRPQGLFGEAEGTRA